MEVEYLNTDVRYVNIKLLKLLVLLFWCYIL